MQNNYLIPANTKKSQYIFGFFTLPELLMFLTGIGISFILLVIIKSVNLGVMVLVMLPGLITGFLVMPVPHYHNILQLLTNIFNFFMNRRRYYWKGWAIDEEFSRSSK